MDAVSRTPVPVNEPVRQYQPGSHERAVLESKIKELAGQQTELTMTIDGHQQMAAGEKINVVQPHNKTHVLGQLGNATDVDVAAAIYAAKQAAPGWRALDFEDRAAIFLKAAELLAGPWRATLNAATVLGQSKSPFQAEIDAACEMIDFWRYNVHFARRMLSEQPESAPGTWNRMEYRPLEGFVLAITPFNFTSIAGNLPTAPALLGNVVVWKPSPTQQLSAHYLMRLLEAAGLPPGVINLVTGDGQAVSQVALTHPDLAGIHFTGSTATFQHLWRTVGENIARYRNYPRLVGETGGKDFVIVHPSADHQQPGRHADPRRVRVPGAEVLRGLPRLRARVGLAPHPRRLHRPGGVADDGGRGRRPVAVHGRGHRRPGLRQARRRPRAGQEHRVNTNPGWRPGRRQRGFLRTPDGTRGLRPGRRDLHHRVLRPDPGRARLPGRRDYAEMLAQAADVTPYALTGSILATDRQAIAQATKALRYSAGNFYINDKPTGAVVGQQPFGGARASGTDDKAGSIFNLTRWVSARAIKELFVPPSDYRYPHMG